MITHRKFFFFYLEVLRKILYLPKPPNEGKICVILDLKRMTKKQEIQLFNDRRIRTIWDDKEEKWYFSVVDVIEPFKIWMASVASERLDEMQDPELTDEWSRCGVTTQQYASLTDIVTMAWSGKSTRSYKAHKGLTMQNLRDNMTNVELALNTLAEAATTENCLKR